MSLRLKIHLIVGLLLTLFVLTVFALHIRNVRDSVREEGVAANRVAHQLLNRTVYLQASQGTEALVVYLQGLGRVRANDIRLLDATGAELYRSPPLCAPGQEVMTGIYYGRHPPYEPQIHVFNEHAQAWNRILKWPEKEIFPVHGHGFGCVYTSRKAPEVTQRVDFDGPPAVMEDGRVVPGERHWWLRTGEWGEDLTWCHYARKMGLILWCNPNVMVGHLGQVEEIGKEKFEQCYRDNKTESKLFAMTLEKTDGKYEAVVRNGLGPAIGKEHTLALDEHLRMTPSA